jgi:hypothetical protein
MANVEVKVTIERNGDQIEWMLRPKATYPCKHGAIWCRPCEQEARGLV